MTGTIKRASKRRHAVADRNETWTAEHCAALLKFERLYVEGELVVAR